MMNATIRLSQNSWEKQKDRAIMRARTFIESQQSPDGNWTDFYIPRIGWSTHWVTSYIANILLYADTTAAYLYKARAWLCASELSSGGWGYNQNNLADADSTANVTRFLAATTFTPTQKRWLRRIGDLLLSFQDSDSGGFITYRPLYKSGGWMYEGSAWCSPEVSVTAMVGQALMVINCFAYREALAKVRDYLLRCQSPSGYWETYWWEGRLYGTHLICNLLMQFQEHQHIERAKYWLLSQRSPDGGWGNGFESKSTPFHTALAISTLYTGVRTEADTAAISDGIYWLLENQQEDGSWESSAMLRIPEPYVHNPWCELHRARAQVVFDTNRLFTTATVLSTLLLDKVPKSVDA